MTITSEQIAAFVDGELGDAMRAQVAEAALRDPALSAQIAAERGLREDLRAHFAPIIQEPVPGQWIAMIHAASTTPDARSMDQARLRRQWLSGRGWAGAGIAAALVIGVTIGAQMRSQQPVVAGPDGLHAAGNLAQALDSQLAMAQADQPMRMLGTFRREGGDLCRVFAGPALSGIACHAGGVWQMQCVLPGTRPDGAAYRQAGSRQSGLMAEAQAMARGDPFTAEQERAAQRHGWH